MSDYTIARFGDIKRDVQKRHMSMKRDLYTKLAS